MHIEKVHIAENYYGIKMHILWEQIAQWKLQNMFKMHIQRVHITQKILQNMCKLHIHRVQIAQKI